MLIEKFSGQLKAAPCQQIVERANFFCVPDADYCLRVSRGKDECFVGVYLLEVLIVLGR